MLRLGESEPDYCACGSANPPGANWCAICGGPLGSHPAFVAGGGWSIEPSEFFDVTQGQLLGQTPRLWRSGGAGAWYLTESSAGIATARILNSGGFAGDREGFSLGPFSGIRAVEATRRGLYCTTSSGLVTVLGPFTEPWRWAVKPADEERQGPPISGLAAGPGGQLYRMTRSETRVHLWLGSGIGSWRELASASAIGARPGWIHLLVAASGDVLFWGGGLVGSFEARRRRMVTKLLPEVADLPLAIAERMAVLPPGGAGGWSRASPVLVRLEDGALGLLEWRDSAPLLLRLPDNVPQLLAAASVEGAVVARAGAEMLRISAGSAPPAVVTRGGAPHTHDAAAIGDGRGAVFIVAYEGMSRAEFVAGGDRVAAARDTLKLGGDGAIPSGPGFEPLAICSYTPQAGSLHRIWIALDYGTAHRSGALQRIQRVRISA